MLSYTNKSGRSGVKSYELDDSGITIEFKNGGSYRYDIEDNGPYIISRMHAMANNGEYLNRMINAEKPKYVGASGMLGIAGDIRKLSSGDERAMRDIHNKYTFGKKSWKDMIETANRKKMNQASTYKEWSKFR